MNIRKKLAALGILGLTAATSAHAAVIDGAAQASNIQTFVDGGLSSLVNSLLTLSVGVFIVGLALRYARRGSK